MGLIANVMFVKWCDMYFVRLFYFFYKKVFTRTEAVVGRFIQNSCSQKFCKFHRKTSVLENLLNNVAGLNNTLAYFFANFKLVLLLKVLLLKNSCYSFEVL